MKKTKTQKGITLVALIITIVVLLILASVAISSIVNTDIIGHANNAATKFNQAQEKENILLNEYINFLNDDLSSGGSGELITYTWTQNRTSVTNGEITLEVGDSVTLQLGNGTPVEYTEGGYTWKVLGAENGKLLLATISDVGNITLDDKEGYNTGISQLNAMCDDYLNTTYADEARSIKVDDINRITGYTPTTGATATWPNEDGYTFEHPTLGYASESNPITEQDTSYNYLLGDYSSDEWESKFNFGDVWLASQYVAVDSYEAKYGLFTLQELHGVNCFSDMWRAVEMRSDGPYNNGVRSVVSIKSNIKVEKV